MADGWGGVEKRDPDQFGYEARRPWKFACPEPNCYYLVSADSEERAIQERDNHDCPRWGGETKVSWSVTRTLVEQMWDKLDLSMGKLMDKKGNEEELAAHKVRARAVAECIAIFMEPFFKTADEVAKEAAKRYKAKLAGEEYETPGMGARRYERPGLESQAVGWYKAPDGGHTSDVAQAGIQPNKKSGGGSGITPALRMKPEEIAAIKFAANSGMFTNADLAKTYGVSEAVIRQVIGG